MLVLQSGEGSLSESLGELGLLPLAERDVAIGNRRSRYGPALILAATIALFLLGSNFYPYFFPHYIAAIACLILLVQIEGAARLGRWTIRGYPAGSAAAAGRSHARTLL